MTMTVTVESWTQQGNTYFQAGKKNEAITCYYHALKQSGALKSVVKYVQKNKDNLFEDQEMLKELLYTKYNIHLVHQALPLILISTKNQVEEIEEAKEYQRFKKLILSKHPTTVEQYIDFYLNEFENDKCKEKEFLSKLLIEQGYNYSLCDINRLCNLQAHMRDLAKFERSLKQKPKMITQIDNMSGHEFEDFIKELLIKLRYQIIKQKRTRDQGLDLLLKHHGKLIACQIKRCAKPITNRAVQQVVTARQFYHCEEALIITNNIFTSGAKECAQQCRVDLWDRHILKEKIKTIQ